MEKSDDIVKVAEGETEARLPGLADLGLDWRSLGRAAPWALGAGLATGGASAWLGSREPRNPRESKEDRNKRILRNAMMTGLPVAGGTLVGIPALQAAFGLAGGGGGEDNPGAMDKVKDLLMSWTGVGGSAGALLGARSGYKNWGKTIAKSTESQLTKLLDKSYLRALGPLANPKDYHEIRSGVPGSIVHKGPFLTRLGVHPDPAMESIARKLQAFFESPSPDKLKEFSNLKKKDLAQVIKLLKPDPTVRAHFFDPAHDKAVNKMVRELTKNRSGVGSGRAMGQFGARTGLGLGLGAGLGFALPPAISAIVDKLSSPNTFQYNVGTK